MSYVAALELTAGDRTAVLFPLYYISGLHAHLLPMTLVGGTSVLLAEPSPREYVETLAAERITWAYCVPSFWLLLLREDGFHGGALPELRVGAFGGSPFPQSMLPALRERMPDLRLHDIYGLSETHSPATMLLDADLDAKPGTVGRPLPCMEARVVDDDGVVVPADAPGELELRGSLVTTGYYRDEKATADAIREGWFRTGDLARIDGDGYVTILDRKKDMITRGGFKVFSVEVEQLLLRHPAITDAAVVGVPDPIAYEAVAAYVVPATDGEVTPRDVQRWVAEQMSDYAVPRQVRVVDAIPRNRTGKIVKSELRDRLLDELPRLRELADERAAGTA
jgi:long-chain acyl-CoA synthetase